MNHLRLTVVLAGLVLIVSPLAALDDMPIQSWGAPPYWSPPSAPREPSEDPAAQKSLRIGPEAMTAGAPTPLPFVAITPCRLADTRAANGFPSPYGPPSIHGSGTQRSFTITGQCSIPADAQAVSFNFTVWAPVTRGDIRVFPAGGATPTVSTLNWEANILALANAAIVPLGAGGAITVQVDGAGTIDLIIDVNGYYSPLGVVNTVNGLSGEVTLSPGNNVTITPSGQSLTIASSAPQGPMGPTGPTGPQGVAGPTGATGATGSNPLGTYLLGAPGDTTLLGAGYTEVGASSIEFWSPTSMTGAPAARDRHTAVWTGTEMIVWGGYPATATGGRYDPSTNSWRATPTIGAAGARWLHSAVWTGTEMIVWGGYNGVHLNTGGRYNPTSNSWAGMNIAFAPTARYDHSAVWASGIPTPSMIVWGGGAAVTNTGGIYNPAADSWQDTSVGANVPSSRTNHTAVWTGTVMIVWGGYDGGTDFVNTGGRYNPTTNAWLTTTTSGAPSNRRYHAAVWTGSRMVVWGGEDFTSTDLATGGLYDPIGNVWTSTPTVGAPAARHFHTAVWTGMVMVVWGGNSGGTSLTSGGVYSPGANDWAMTKVVAAPSGRYDHTAIWTGSKMIVWGGNALGEVNNTGGVYQFLSVYLKN